MQIIELLHRMSETAEAVAANITTRRNVTIEISNVTNNYCLINPRVFLDSGEVYNPPQPTVRPLHTEVCTFSKSSSKATGSVGVLTYDLYERTRSDYIETVAMMFSCPGTTTCTRTGSPWASTPRGASATPPLQRDVLRQEAAALRPGGGGGLRDRLRRELPGHQGHHVADGPRHHEGGGLGFPVHSQSTALRSCRRVLSVPPPPPPPPV
ncbi:unnamed protein product [Gadus morhua 'NCC']